MRNNSDLVVKAALLISDFLVIVGSFVTAYIIRVQWDDRALASPVESKTFLFLLIGLVPVWLIIFAALELYKRKIYQSRVEEASRILFGSAIGVMMIVFIDFLIDQPIFPARLVPIYGFGISFIAVLLARNIIHSLRFRLYARGIGVKRTLLITNPGATKTLRAIIDNQPTGHQILAVVGARSNISFESRGIKRYKTLSSAFAQIGPKRIDTIIQTGVSDNQKDNSLIMDAVQNNHLDYLIYPTFESGITVQSHIELLDGQPYLKVNRTPLDGWWRILKRLIDIFGSLLALIVLAPLIVLIGLVIKISDPGPAIFKHRRVTRFGDSFYVYKFRSMKQKFSGVGDHSFDHRIKQFKQMGREDLIEEFKKFNKVKNDPRVSKVGKFLRSTSLDELPQFYNVLRGDLSLVGPRPVAPDELIMYEGSYESLFLSIRPGLSGLWQVSGRSDISNVERVQLDIYYIQNWSLILDIKIILKTILVVLKRVGSS